MPVGASFVLTLFGNAVSVSIAQKLFATLLFSRMSNMLSKIKYGALGTAPSNIVRTQKNRVASEFIFAVVALLLAPILSVFVLDENCLRYYLAFSDSLRELMEAWSIGKVGPEAYRQNFCSRKLISEFGYVWLTTVLWETFGTPAMYFSAMIPVWFTLNPI